jgi:hypothetical protein
MPPPPPLQDILSAVQDVMLPAAGISALVFALLLNLGRWAHSLAAALGLIAGVAFVNWNKSLFPWIPDTATWHQLPLATLFLVLFSLLCSLILSTVRRFGSEKWQFRSELLCWLVRLIAVGFCHWMILPEALRLDKPWIWPVLTLLATLNWRVLDQLSYREAHVELVILIALNVMLGSGVLLYAHSARFMELGTAFGCAALGIAVVSQLTKSATSGVLPVFIGLWPGLLLSGYWGNSSEDIPLGVFTLVAAAPLVLLPWLIPAIWRGPIWLHRVLWFILMLVPVLFALGLAGEYGKLPWEEEW